MEVAQSLQERPLVRGEVVLREGERAAGFFIVAAGRMEVVLEDTQEGQVHLTYLGPGDYFGDMSLMTGEPSYATIQAAEDAVLYMLPPVAFNKLLMRYPRLYQDFVAALYHRLNQLHMGISDARSKANLVSRLLADERLEHYGQLVGATRAAKDLKGMIRKLAGSRGPVLLRGEKGVGKELVARLIHQAGPGSQDPFLALDCGQLIDDGAGEQILGSRPSVGGGSMGRTPGLVDVVDGGTILLKNVELLPREAQERLARYLEVSGGRGTRIMATSRADLEGAAEGGRFSPALLEVLGKRTVTLPPLRERKRDIPLLASYFAERKAELMGKEIDTTLAPHDLEHLLAYDYVTGNVQELEDIVERAVSLADGPRILSEHLFLGRPGDAPASHDILRWPWLRRLTMRNIFPGWLAYGGTAAFLVALGVLLFGPQNGAANPMIAIAWALWWPGLWLSTVFFARFWCAVCPFQTLGKLAQRFKHLNKPVPAFVQKRSHVLVTAGFLIIIWVEEITGMRQWPRGTGLLLLAITLGAVIHHVLLTRQAWCRYLCPLGSMVGVAAMGSALELRANTDICQSCNTHECYKGSATAPGCPQFLHLPFVDSNQNCTLCMNCVRSCPNESPRLHLRIPARELWRLTRVSPEMVYFVGALQSILLPVMAFQKGWLSPAAFTIVFVGAALLFAGAVKGVHLLARRSGTYDEAQALKQAWYAHLPLALGGQIAYQFNHVPLVPTLSVQVLQGSPAATSAVTAVSLLGFLQMAVLAGGLCLSFYAVWRVSRREELGRWRSSRFLWWAHIAVVGAYGAAVAFFLRLV